MSAFGDEAGSLAHRRVSSMIWKTSALRTALRRREPRCRICRDDAVRIRVDALLDWVGVPIVLGPNKFHVVTYADILRDLEPLNGRRAPKDRITYNSLWVHAKRHYDLSGISDYWADRLDKEFREVLGIPMPGSAQLRRQV